MARKAKSTKNKQQQELQNGPPFLSIHSTVKLCRKGILQTKREAFFKKMCFQIFLERRERWRAADVCRKRTLNTPIKRKSSSSKGMKRIAHNNQNSSRRRNTKTNYYLLWKHIHDNGIICCLLLTLFAVFSTQCNSNSYDGLATLRLQEQNEQKVYLTNRLEFLIILNNHCTCTSS